MDRSLVCTPAPAMLESLEPRLLLSVSAETQVFVYLLNRARHDPAAYATEAGLAADLTGVAPQAPLAVSDSLFTSAEFHAGEMATNDYFAHQSAVTTEWPNQMADDAGYTLPAAWPLAANNIESIGEGVTTAAEALDLLLENAGTDPLDNAAHLLASAVAYEGHNEIGVGHAADGASAFGDYWAVHTAYTDGGGPYLTGVVYNDLNANDRYDLNEGLAGVEITNGTATVTTNDFGGWVMASDGSAQNLLCSGGAFVGAADAFVFGHERNVEVDFTSADADGVVNFGVATVQEPGAPAGLAATDGTHTDKVALTWNASNTATAYAVWRSADTNPANATQLASVVDTAYDDTTAAPGATYTYWVTASNALGTSGFSTSNAGRRNASPTVGTLTASADPISRGDPLTLTATDLADTEGAVRWVCFYADTDGSAAYEAANDALIGWGWVGANGTATKPIYTATLPYGDTHFFARAYDSDGARGDAADVSVTVTNPDAVAPAAVLDADNLTIPTGWAGHTFTVTFTDNVGVDPYSLRTGAIVVTGPGAYQETAALVGVDAWSDGTPRTATYRVRGPGNNWDFTDNGTYTVSVAADTAADWNGNPVPAGDLGTFDVAIADQPDLTVTIDRATWPAIAVPGDRGYVQVTITNAGGVAAEGAVTTNLHLSDDQALGGDTLLATRTTTLRLAPGQSQTAWYYTTVPGDLAPGNVYLLADVDATDQVAEVSEVNNLAATDDPFAVVWQFGTVGARTNVPLTVADPDGTNVTFRLTGNGGTGTVSVGAEGLDVQLAGTDERSSVSIRPAGWNAGGNGEADIGDVTIGDPGDPADRTSLGRFTGYRTDLHGDFLATAGVGWITLDDIIGDASLTLQNQPDDMTLTLRADRVSDFSIDSAIPIQTLSVADWLDTGGADDTLTAPSVAYLYANGSWWDGVAGTVQANITLTDADATLRYANITGWFDGAALRTAGNLGYLRVGGLQNALVFAGIEAAVTDLPDAAGDFNAARTIQSLTVSGVTGAAHSWLNSNVAADHIVRVSAVNIDYDNNGTDHGLAANTLGSLTYHDADLWYHWPNTNPAEADGPLPRQDFTVNTGTVNGAPSIENATFAVDENTANGTNVGTPLAVTDPDAADTTAWAITDGNAAGVFAIDADTGQITVADNTNLDYETTTQFALTVQVTDSGALSDTAVVTVNVGDVNEAPEIAPGQTFSVAEDAVNGTSVGTVSATDPENNIDTYEITGGNGDGVFAIDAGTGQITIDDNTNLDFETTPQYTLTIRATDTGALTDVEDVTINVTDVLD